MSTGCMSGCVSMRAALLTEEAMYYSLCANKTPLLIILLVQVVAWCSYKLSSPCLGSHVCENPLCILKWSNYWVIYLMHFVGLYPLGGRLSFTTIGVHARSTLLSVTKSDG